MMRSTRRSLAALALVALVGAGCSSGADENSDTGSTKTATGGKGVKFSACMRDNGVTGFPDPDASGELTIDGVLNGSTLDASSAAWKRAIAACKDLQPAGFTGDKDVTPEQQEGRLAFAQCMRDNGVEDFPDPAPGEPLVNTNLIPSAAEPGGMDVINAGMQACGDAASKAMGK